VERRLAARVDCGQRGAARDEERGGLGGEIGENGERSARACQVQRRAPVHLALRLRPSLEQEPHAREPRLRDGVDGRRRRVARRERRGDR